MFCSYEEMRPCLAPQSVRPPQPVVPNILWPVPSKTAAALRTKGPRWAFQASRSCASVHHVLPRTRSSNESHLLMGPRLLCRHWLRLENLSETMPIACCMRQFSIEHSFAHCAAKWSSPIRATCPAHPKCLRRSCPESSTLPTASTARRRIRCCLLRNSVHPMASGFFMQSISLRQCRSNDWTSFSKPWVKIKPSVPCSRVRPIVDMYRSIRLSKGTLRRHSWERRWNQWCQARRMQNLIDVKLSADGDKLEPSTSMESTRVNSTPSMFIAPSVSPCCCRAASLTIHLHFDSLT